MSGGSYDYAYAKINDLADQIESSGSRNPLRLAFAKHLRLCAEAAHDIEWVDSCDYGKGQEVEAIRKVVSPNEVLAPAIELAEQALRNLREAIDEARKP